MPCMEGYFKLVHWQDSLDKSMGGQFSLVYDRFIVLKGHFDVVNGQSV